MVLKNLNNYIHKGTSLCSALLVRKLSKQLEVQALVRIHDGNLFYSWLIYVGNVRREGKKHKNDKKEST